MNSKVLAKEINLKAEIKEIESKMSVKRITKTKVDSLRKMNKMDKSPSKLNKKMSQICNSGHGKRHHYRCKRC